MVILDLDDKTNMKCKLIEKNIKTIIEKYGKNNKSKKNKFTKYFMNYSLCIKFQKKLINMYIKINIDQLNKHVSYTLGTTEVENKDKDKNWYNANNQSYSGFPGVTITFLDKSCDKKDAYIDFIAKNEKHKIESGTEALQLAIRLCKYIGIRDGYLQDDSKIQCLFPRDLSLSLLKLLTTGNTWYEKHGFKLNVTDYKKIRLAIEKVKKIKMNNIIKTVKNIRDALQDVINSGEYKKFKLWSPFADGMAVHGSSWLSKEYEYYANTYLILKRSIKKGDTLSKYSERIVKENCKNYLESIQKLLFSYNNRNIGSNLLVINYKNKWINYPYVKEIYLVNLLVDNWEIKYKKRINN